MALLLKATRKGEEEKQDNRKVDALRKIKKTQKLISNKWEDGELNQCK